MPLRVYLQREYARCYGLSVRLVLNTPTVPTPIHNTAVSEKATKRLTNGQLLIIRDGKTYNPLGAEVK